jgi:hypothetical protein
LYDFRVPYLDIKGRLRPSIGLIIVVTLRLQSSAYLELYTYHIYSSRSYLKSPIAFKMVYFKPITAQTIQDLKNVAGKESEDVSISGALLKNILGEGHIETLTSGQYGLHADSPLLKDHGNELPVAMVKVLQGGGFGKALRLYKGDERRALNEGIVMGDRESK